MAARESTSQDLFPGGKPLLDETNLRLLDALTADPRATAAELARQVGMSAPAVRERIARLEQAGVIRGYRLDIDPAAIGLPVAAWVRIRPGPGQLSRIAATWPPAPRRSASATASPARIASCSRCTCPRSPTWRRCSTSS